MQNVSIDHECVVTLSYQLRNKLGHLLEECSVNEPCTFIQGLGQILPAIEDAIQGKTKGYSISLVLSPEQAYGVYRKELRTHVSRDAFPKEVAIEKGIKFSTVGPNGEGLTITVVEVVGDRVTIDGNHPLAGEELHFDLKVLDVRHATEQELQERRVLGMSSSQLH